MAKKLHYFDIIGIAESIRYMLHYSNQKFEDIRYDVKTWPDEEVKKALPFGQMPLYEEGDKTLNQSMAIARYIAATNNLLPPDLWEQAQLDAVVLSVYDFVAKLKNQDPEKSKTLKKESLEEAVDFYFPWFEKQLKNNNGFFGRKGIFFNRRSLLWFHLSWADFVLIGFVEAVNLHSNDQIERNYPHVVELMEKIRSLPGVKEYISTRKDYVV